MPAERTGRQVAARRRQESLPWRIFTTPFRIIGSMLTATEQGQSVQDQDQQIHPTQPQPPRQNAANPGPEMPSSPAAQKPLAKRRRSMSGIPPDESATTESKRATPRSAAAHRAAGLDSTEDKPLRRNLHAMGFDRANIKSLRPTPYQRSTRALRSTNTGLSTGSSTSPVKEELERARQSMYQALEERTKSESLRFSAPDIDMPDIASHSSVAASQSDGRFDHPPEINVLIKSIINPPRKITDEEYDLLPFGTTLYEWQYDRWREWDESPTLLMVAHGENPDVEEPLDKQALAANLFGSSQTRSDFLQTVQPWSDPNALRRTKKEPPRMPPSRSNGSSDGQPIPDQLWYSASHGLKGRLPLSSGLDIDRSRPPRRILSLENDMDVDSRARSRSVSPTGGRPSEFMSIAARRRRIEFQQQLENQRKRKSGEVSNSTTSTPGAEPESTLPPHKTVKPNSDSEADLSSRKAARSRNKHKRRHDMTSSSSSNSDSQSGASTSSSSDDERHSRRHKSKKRRTRLQPRVTTEMGIQCDPLMSPPRRRVPSNPSIPPTASPSTGKNNIASSSSASSLFSATSSNPPPSSGASEPFATISPKRTITASDATETPKSHAPTFTFGESGSVSAQRTPFLKALPGSNSKNTLLAGPSPPAPPALPSATDSNIASSAKQESHSSSTPPFSLGTQSALTSAPPAVALTPAPSGSSEDQKQPIPDKKTPEIKSTPKQDDYPGEPMMISPFTSSASAPSNQPSTLPSRPLNFGNPESNPFLVPSTPQQPTPNPSAPAFGFSLPTSISASAPNTPSVPILFGNAGNAQQTPAAPPPAPASAPVFNFGASTPAPSLQSQSTPAFQFGGTPATSSSSAAPAITFGDQSKPSNATAPSKTEPSSTPGLFTFGAPSLSAASSSSGQSMQSGPTAAPPAASKFTFNFGGSSAQPGAAAPNFGQSSNGASGGPIFGGAPAQTAAQPSQQQSSATPAFGGFGNSSNNPTSSGALAFGNTPSAASNPFGNMSNPIPASTTASAPSAFSFGSGAQQSNGMVGQQPPSFGGFGSNNTTSTPFAFGSAQPSQLSGPSTTSSFNFGATNSGSGAPGTFNFNAPSLNIASGFAGGAPSSSLPSTGGSIFTGSTPAPPPGDQQNLVSGVKAARPKLKPKRR